MKKTKIVMPFAASLLLAVAPAWADDYESETRVEERVERQGDADIDERRTERSYQAEREDAFGTRTESQKSTQEEVIDGGDVDIERRTESETTVDE